MKRSVVFPQPISIFSTRFSHARSRFLLSFALLWLVGTLVQPATAQKKGDDDANATAETLSSLADGLPIHITYVAADPARVEGALENAPVVILIHGLNGNRLVWENKPTNFRKQPMVNVLRENGYACVTVDMRGHGESPLKTGKPVGNADYPAMLGDIEAVKEFLMKEHQEKRLNINKLGIVAADDMTPVALQYAEADWKKPDYDDAPVPSRRTPRGRDVRGLVLLSPVNQAGRLSAPRAANFLKRPDVAIGIFVAVGSEDRLDGGFAERLAKQFQAKPVEELNAKAPESAESPAPSPIDQKKTFVPPVVIGTYNTPLRGTDLIGQPGMLTELHIMQFLDKSVKELEIPWRNRKSRIAR